LVGDDDQRGCFAVNSMRELAGLPTEAQEIISSSQQKLTRLLIKNIEAEDPKLEASMIADVVLMILRSTTLAAFEVLRNAGRRGRTSAQHRRSCSPQFRIFRLDCFLSAVA